MKQQTLFYRFWFKSCFDSSLNNNRHKSSTKIKIELKQKTNFRFSSCVCVPLDRLACSIWGFVILFFVYTDLHFAYAINSRFTIDSTPIPLAIALVLKENESSKTTRGDLNPLFSLVWISATKKKKTIKKTCLTVWTIIYSQKPLRFVMKRSNDETQFLLLLIHHSGIRDIFMRNCFTHFSIRTYFGY